MQNKRKLETNQTLEESGRERESKKPTKPIAVERISKG